MNLLDHITFLFESQLYDDVKTTASLILSLGENNPDMLMASVKYQILLYQGEALIKLSEYRKAESVLKKALRLKKMISKTRGKAPNLEQPFGDTELKFKLHLCYCQMKQFDEAISVLESISAKQRCSKVNLALANLYRRMGLDRSAVTAYKEVLRECPMSLEAANGLLSLGVIGAEVDSLMKSSLPSGSNLEWLFSMVKGQAFSSAKDYSNAVQTFKLLDCKPHLRDNHEVLCCLGEAQFLNGDYAQSLVTLRRAHTLDPFLVRHMDLLAFLYYREKQFKELEVLSTELMAVTDAAPEPWVAVGYFCMATKKSSRTVYFAQKALNIDSHCLEALLLKGASLLELKKISEATLHFREALRLAPHRYEAHKGLVDCYSGHRIREAIYYAGQACKQLTNARSLTLYASVLARERLNLEKAKGYLEKAMRMDPNYLEAVYIMADVFRQQQQPDKGIELLKNHLVQHSTCRLHQLLADFLAHTSDYQAALEHYNLALNLEPGNPAAREGLERVEKHGDISIDNAYDVEVDEMEGTDHEAELEGSGVEESWSDNEF